MIGGCAVVGRPGPADPEWGMALASQGAAAGAGAGATRSTRSTKPAETPRPAGATVDLLAVARGAGWAPAPRVPVRAC